MQRNAPQQGISTAAVVITVATVLVIAAIGYAVLRQPTTAPAATQSPKKNSGAVSAPVTPSTGQPATEETRPAAQPDDTPITYSGTRLAGDSAPLLAFTAADYAAAMQTDKLIVLYFYANWCPICQAEFPLMEDAFNQLTSADVIGFRVNFNDNETDDAERNLARQHGIAYQHTKVFVRGNQQTLKSPETWDTSRYLTEINQALAAQ